MPYLLNFQTLQALFCAFSNSWGRYTSLGVVACEQNFTIDDETISQQPWSPQSKSPTTLEKLGGICLLCQFERC